MKLRIAGLVNDSIVDGPGFRFTVFTQGCPHNCPGCHNPQTHDFSGGREADTAEIVAVQTLRHSGGMHHIVERVVLKPAFQLLGRREVELNEVYALVGEITARTCRPHRGPHVHATAQRFFNDKAADEAACAGY